MFLNNGCYMYGVSKERVVHVRRFEMAVGTYATFRNGGGRMYDVSKWRWAHVRRFEITVGTYDVHANAPRNYIPRQCELQR